MLSALGKICMLAKPPRPGAVKTRLTHALGSRAAAELAAAFVRDTWSSLASLEWANRVLATTDAEFDGWPFIEPSDIWLQGEGDLGARIERVLGRALGDAQFAIAIGSDTPGLPRTLLERARVLLRENDAVLGPCEDGGFYLIGLRRCPGGILSDIPWSSERTFTATLARLRGFGLTTGILPGWFDVDRPGDLDLLKRLLDGGEVSAPMTEAWFARRDRALPRRPEVRR